MAKRPSVAVGHVVHPESMPEPNDLLGAVEERATLTFSGFDPLPNP